MKKLLAVTAILIAISSTNPAYAVDLKDFKRPDREQMQKMSKAEKLSFMDERKAKWDKLSKSEKIEVIEHRRKEKIEMMEDHWNKMSDDEKIAFVEKRMEGRRKMIEKGERMRRPMDGMGNHEDKGF